MGSRSLFNLEEVEFVGANLFRPECVLCTANGRIFCSDWRGGVTVIEPDGGQWFLKAHSSVIQIKPNGICLLPDGSLLLAHLGAGEDGGVYRLTEDGVLSPYLVEVDGRPLPPTNYVHLDTTGRLWITVSTRLVPRARAYRADVADGFIVLLDGGGARMVADGLGYTNECGVHPDGRRLFVNETFGRRLISFSIREDGSLTNKRTVAEFDAGYFPDGLAFDAEGGTWVTSVVSNRVIRVDSYGTTSLILEDNEPSHVAWVEDAYNRGIMDKSHLETTKGRLLRNISSLAFAGPDMKEIYLGCLLGDRIAKFTSLTSGYAPPYWNFPGPGRINTNLKEGQS